MEVLMKVCIFLIDTIIDASKHICTFRDICTNHLPDKQVGYNVDLGTFLLMNCRLFKMSKTACKISKMCPKP